MLPYIDIPFIWLSQTLGPSKDELKLIFSIFLSYPLSGILKRIPDAEPWKKNLFIIFVSFFYLTGLFDLWIGFLTLLGTSLATYFAAKTIKSPFMPWLVFVGLMGHMLYLHAYRELFPLPGVVDITGAQMVLVMKLTSFAWAVHDGRQPFSELSDFQKDRVIKDMPGLIDYLGFVFFFPALFTGPAFDFAEYRRWIDCSMFDVVVLSKSPSGSKRKRKIPKSHMPAIKKALEAIFWFGAVIKFGTWFNVPFLLSSEFLHYGFLRRVFYIYGLGITSRLKYYGAWALSEGACILSGLGYNGIDPTTKKAKWDRLTNVDPWRLETAQNARGFLDAWNMNTNKWLRNYVYLRITPRGKKPGFRSTLGTFATSAIWHGISPGYYLTFISGAFVQTIAKYFRRHVRPFFLAADGKSSSPYKPLYDVIGAVATQIIFAYIVIPFVTLDRKSSLTAWARLKFFGHLSILALYLYFHSPYGKPFLTQLQKKRVTQTTEPQTGMPLSNLSDDSLRSAGGTGIRIRGPGPLGLPTDVDKEFAAGMQEMQEIIAAKKRLNAQRLQSKKTE